MCYLKEYCCISVRDITAESTIHPWSRPRCCPACLSVKSVCRLYALIASSIPDHYVQLKHNTSPEEGRLSHGNKQHANKIWQIAVILFTYKVIIFVRWRQCMVVLTIRNDHLVFTALRYVSAVDAVVVCLYVRTSVRLLFVTRRYCTKTAKPRITQIGLMPVHVCADNRHLSVCMCSQYPPNLVAW